ncbi:MAG: hypothetical protein QW752_03550 [Thermoplasmata archaeon]
MITNNKLDCSIDYHPPREFRRKFLNNFSFREVYINRIKAKLNK